MRLPFLPYAHAAIVTLHKQQIAALAYLTLIRCWEGYFCGHSYFSGSYNIAARELRIITVDAFSFLEQNLDSLSGNLLCGRFHVYVSLCSILYYFETDLELDSWFIMLLLALTVS